jgi:hypothetical protein
MREEILAAPYAVWLAPVGTAFPAIQTAPTGAWVLLGTSGTKSYDEDGVTVEHPQTIETFTPAGGTVARKAFRTEEDQIINVNLVDLSTIQYAKILNNATVTTVAAGAGVAGQKHFPTMRGLTVATFALLLRGMSTETEGLVGEKQCPIVYEASEPSPQFTKGEPAVLECSFASLEDDTAGLGRTGNQTAAPTS